MLPLGAALWFGLLLHAALPALAIGGALGLGLVCSLLPGAAILRHSTATGRKAALAITLWSAALAGVYSLSLHLLTA